MLSRHQRHKHLLMLVAAQIGCLAVGLWIHRHLVISAAHRAAEEEAQVDLDTNTSELLSAITRLKLPSSGAESASLGQIKDLFHANRTVPGLQLDLVDPQWRVLAKFRTAGDDVLLSESPGETLVWAEPLDNVDSHANRIAGSLVTPDGRHVAVACSLKDRQGYAVAHYPLERVKVSSDTLLGALPAAGVITWIWTGALLAISVYMIVARFFDRLAEKHEQTETAALRHIQSLLRTRDAVILGLAKLADSRDPTTGWHLDRITCYTSRLAAKLRHDPKYRDVVTPEFVQSISVGSALHDIGKVGIEDSILLKPGPLTEEERERVNQHAAIGGGCLLEIERRLGASNFLQMAREMALWHHERWDGTGYPDGLAGEEIPLAARIVAIADVYEALSSPRTYKAVLPHRQCVEMIRSQAGSHFDPDLVEVFCSIEGAFHQIARQYGHAAPSSEKSLPQVSGGSEDQQCEELISMCEDLVSIGREIDEDRLTPTNQTNRNDGHPSNLATQE